MLLSTFIEFKNHFGPLTVIYWIWKSLRTIMLVEKNSNFYLILCIMFCIKHTSFYFYYSFRWSTRVVQERFQQVYHKEKPKVSIQSKRILWWWCSIPQYYYKYCTAVLFIYSYNILLYTVPVVLYWKTTQYYRYYSNAIKTDTVIVFNTTVL